MASFSDDIRFLENIAEEWEDEYKSATTKAAKNDLSVTLIRARDALERVAKRACICKFEFEIDETDDLPDHGGGRVLFKRDHLITKIANMVLEKPTGKRKYSNHFWNAPIGSGKTVFLKLLGRELASRGYNVYMANGYDIDIIHKKYFKNHVKQVGDKPVVLLMDDVQKYLTRKHWVDLLKRDKPANLVVLGVDVSREKKSSPQVSVRFHDNKDLYPMFLTDDDLPEVMDYLGKTFSKCPEHVIAEFCQRTLRFTSGQIFPFIHILKHLLETKHELDAEKIDDYLSSKEFFESDVREMIRCRCFDVNSIFIIDMMFRKGELDGKNALVTLGLWRNYDFISPLVENDMFLMFNMLKACDDAQRTFDETETNAPCAEQIISTGLSNVSEDNLLNMDNSSIAAAKSLGFHWAFAVRTYMPSVWIAPQPRTWCDDHRGPGCQQKVGFFINGRVNMGIEFIVNASASSLMEYTEKTGDKYKRYKNRTGVVFHLDTKNDTLLQRDWKDKFPVYTFLKKRNELYRNSYMVQRNVSKALPFSPTRSYSTLGVTYLKNALKRL